PQLVSIVALNEFGPGGYGVFDHHVLPFGAGDGEPNGDQVAGSRGSVERREVIDDLLPILSRNELEGVAQDVERDRAVLLQFLVGRVVFGARGIVQAALSAGSDADVVDARLEFGLVENYFRSVDPRGLVELAGDGRGVVDEYSYAQVRVQL